MGMENKAGAYAVCLVVALLLAACNDDKVCPDCNEGGSQPCPTSPDLAAAPGDGQVTLTWEPAVSLGATIKAWQIRQAVQGEDWSAARSTGAAATAYVVSGLKNDVAYTFQARAQLDAADFGCWSTPVSVVPRRIDDVMKEIEKHQKAIAGRMVELVKGLEERQEELEKLRERAIATLGAVATSTSATAEHTAATRDGVAKLACKVDSARDKIVEATNSVAAKVDKAKQDVVDKLDDIVEKLGKGCDGCEALPANCQLLGTAFFGHNSERIENMMWEKDEWPELPTGVFLNIGHASSVGHAVHNLRLSDQRAACVSRCLDVVVGGDFAFMEVARGEILDMSDPEGTSTESDQHRRVDVAFCEDYPIPDAEAAQRDPVWPDGGDCGCKDFDVPI